MMISSDEFRYFADFKLFTIRATRVSKLANIFRESFDKQIEICSVKSGRVVTFNNIYYRSVYNTPQQFDIPANIKSVWVYNAKISNTDVSVNTMSFLLWVWDDL
jgi:hypothetical protein